MFNVYLLPNRFTYKYSKRNNWFNIDSVSLKAQFMRCAEMVGFNPFLKFFLNPNKSSDHFILNCPKNIEIKYYSV